MGMASRHITAMVAVDAATTENGCLQVSPGQWKAGDLAMVDGKLVEEAVEGLEYETVQCLAGDVLFFSGYIPHRSEANGSSNSRRAIFFTYNPLSEGDYHDAYYEAKHQGMQGFNASNAISFQGDFQGVVVD